MFKTKTEEQTTTEKPVVSLFGYELIRSELLPELLGKEERNILYWAGKQLARKYQLQSIEEAAVFFEEAGWGRLEMTEASSSEMVFHLSSPLIDQRLANYIQPSFGIEAGFLAEQIQTLKKYVAEAYETTKKNKVIITVKWDKKDQIEEKSNEKEV